MKRMNFKRSLDSLQEIFEFTSGFFASRQLDPSLLPAVDLIVEELFTNIVEHSTASRADVPMEIRQVDDGVEVTLTDCDTDPFDITRVPEIDVDRPVEERELRGLGLHLVRQLADTIEYEYEYKNRTSRVTFRKTQSGRSRSDTAGNKHV